MDNLLNIFEYAFMWRALGVGIILGGLISFLGIFITLKKMSFFGEGIAHASLSGIALGLLLGTSPLFMAIISAVIFAIVIYILEKRGISGDSAIGIIFSFGMALGALFIGFSKGYKPELMSFLFGNILAIKQSEVYLIAGLSIILFSFLVFFKRELTIMSLDEDLAKTSGIRIDILKPLFYIITAITIVLGIKVLGIMLISSMMIIPVSISRFVSKSFKGVTIVSIITSEMIIISGLIVSFLLDLPTGATIVVIGSALLLLLGAFSALSHKK